MAIYPDLKNKKVLITGCSNGIGEAQTKSFLAQGAQVIGLDILNPSYSDEKFEFFKIDLADLKSLKNLISKFEVDIICNTAGILDGYQKLTEISEEEIENVIQINLKALRVICREYVGKNKPLVIVNMSSYASFYCDGGGYGYSVSKAAINALTKHIAFNYGENVRANAIAPCLVKTRMAEPDFKTGLNIKLEEQTSLNRYADPFDIANLSLFLASEDSSYITGQIIEIDGGFSLGKRI